MEEGEMKNKSICNRCGEEKGAMDLKYEQELADRVNDAKDLLSNLPECQEGEDIIDDVEELKKLLDELIFYIHYGHKEIKT
jgi:hypothetical protein